jgi:hypothetical protein
MIVRRRILLAVVALSIALTDPRIGVAAGEEAAWTITLRPADFVIGVALKQLHTRHAWIADFDDQTGAFEVAVRKTAVAIPAPECRMDYLILKIPSYYPENPKQASVSERRAVYDALVGIKDKGGSVTARVEAPDALARMGPRGFELAACNLYFALPLSVQISTH